MLEELREKHLLVDTNVLSSIFDNPEQYNPLLTKLQELGVVLCINAYINIEFIRIACNPVQRKEIEDFFEKHFLELPFTMDLHVAVKDFYPFYNHCENVRNKNQVSVVDALNVAYLKKYGQNLYFITFDHSDFPLEILDRVEVGAVDLGSEIASWGIYKYNATNFKELAEKFEKCKRPPRGHLA